ncbi:MAG: ferric iron reductase [Ilumatobacteraceae bacterium]|nr:ferric iron reductase [Ilumatobacteraceae bacterium]
MTGRLDDVIAAVQARVGYLRCATAAPPAEGWVPCDALVGDPELLRGEIDATAAGRGTADPQIAASLYAQAYAFRVPSIAVAAYALDLPVPAVDPVSTAVRVTRHRPADLAIVEPACMPMDAEALATALFVGHLVPFVAAVRAGTTIGERLLWGNVAGSLATIFRAVQSTGSRGDAAVRERAVAFEVAAAPWIGGLGSWSSIEAPDALGWYWNRSSCCLWYRTADGSYCDDCSLLDASELAAKRRADLTGSHSR